MKRIKEYKKLFKVEGAIDLKELKTTYRGLVKEWHPDKFQDKEQKKEAGEISLKIIDVYHFDSMLSSYLVRERLTGGCVMF